VCPLGPPSRHLPHLPDDVMTAAVLRALCAHHRRYRCPWIGAACAHAGVNHGRVSDVPATFDRPRELKMGCGGRDLRECPSLAFVKKHGSLATFHAGASCSGASVAPRVGTPSSDGSRKDAAPVAPSSNSTWRHGSHRAAHPARKGGRRSGLALANKAVLRGVRRCSKS
jgi:hypothetical protein